MKYFIPILVTALIFRIYISFLGYHVDIFSNAGWGQWINNHGSKGFYENNVWIYSWPTQPPLVSLVYANSNQIYLKLQNYLIRFTAKVAPLLSGQPKEALVRINDGFSSNLLETPFPVGYVFSIKLLSIFSDLLIAIVFFYLLPKGKIRYLLSSFFLFFPFSWYISSLWGQYDPVSFILLLFSFLILDKKKFTLSSFLFSLSLTMKPTGLIFVPIYIFYFFKLGPKLSSIVSSIVLSFGFLFYSTSLFTDRNVLDFMVNRLYPVIFKKTEFRLTTVSFNFWWIFVGKTNLTQEFPFLLIPAKFWSYLFYLMLNIYAIKKFSKPSRQNMIFALYIIGMGSFLFLVNMLERYAYTGVVSLLLLASFDFRLILPGFVSAMVFMMNLYYSWGFPLNYDFPDWSTRLLALINVILFLVVIAHLPRLKYSNKANETTF